MYFTLQNLPSCFLSASSPCWFTDDYKHAIKWSICSTTTDDDYTWTVYPCRLHHKPQLLRNLWRRNRLNLERFLGYVCAWTMRTIRYQDYKQQLFLESKTSIKPKENYISHTIKKTICVTFSCVNVSKAFGE